MSVSNLLYPNNYNLYSNTMNIGATSSIIDLNSALTISSKKAILLPRLTTTERNALTAANGMAIYNTTTNEFQVYQGGTWHSGSSGTVLAGDVSGPANSNTVDLVGGVTAANVAAGANLANAATTANTNNAIVKRDGSGEFTTSNITLSGLTASQIVSTNGSKKLASVATTGTGNVVLASGPTLTLPVISQISNTGTLTLPATTGTVWASGRNNTNSTQACFVGKLDTCSANLTGDGTPMPSSAGMVWTEISDVGGNFSGGVFTAPVTGVYQISIGWCYTGLDTNHAFGSMQIDAGPSNIEFLHNPASQKMGASSTLGGFSYTILQPVGVGETISLTWAVDNTSGGGAKTVSLQANRDTWWSIALLF